MADLRTKIMDLGIATPVNTDWIPFIDISDLTQSPAGSTKRALKSNLKGDTGDNATATVGTTTTGSPGTNASVTNVGTTSDAIFDFVIPRGDVGAIGADSTVPGPAGVDGNGIVSVILTSGDHSAGTLDTYTITYTDTTTSTFQVYNGANGAGAGDMLKSENLSRLANYETARANLGIIDDVTVQATKTYSSDKIQALHNTQAQAIQNLSGASATFHSSTPTLIPETPTAFLDLTWTNDISSSNSSIFELGTNEVTFKKDGNYNFLNSMVFSRASSGAIVNITFQLYDADTSTILLSASLPLDIPAGTAEVVPMNVLLPISGTTSIDPVRMKVRMQASSVAGTVTMDSFSTILFAQSVVNIADIDAVPTDGSVNAVQSNGVYDFALTTPDFYKYTLSRTVDGSGNMTTTVYNYEGNTPTTAKPIKVQIGGVVRTITSALSHTQNSGFSWMNLGSAGLATKEVDLFAYLGFVTASSQVVIGWGRFGTALTNGDTSNASIENEKYCGMNVNMATTDNIVCIGRFNVILSAGAGYTWSIPTTSTIINSPIFSGNLVPNALPRVNKTISITTSVTMDAFSYDLYDITAQAGALLFNKPAISSPYNGQKIMFRIKDNGTARLLTYGTGIKSGSGTLPPTTTISKKTWGGLQYDITDDVWYCIASGTEA